MMSGPVITSFQEDVQKDLDANGQNQSDAKQRLLNIMNERIKEELRMEEEANKIIERMDREDEQRASSVKELYQEF